MGFWWKYGSTRCCRITAACLQRQPSVVSRFFGMSIISIASIKTVDEQKNPVLGQNSTILSDAELRRARSQNIPPNRSSMFAGLSLPAAEKTAMSGHSPHFRRAEDIISHAASLNFRVSLISENIENQVFKIHHLHDKAKETSIIIPATLSENERKRVLAENLRQILPPA